MLYDQAAGPGADTAPPARPPWPAGGQASASVELPALPVTPAWARRHATAVLGAWQVHPETIEMAVLLVSELVTNAVAAVSSGPQITPGAPITQALRYDADHVVIEVSDRDPRPPVPADTGPYDEAGRGLMLVQALSKEWTCTFPPAGGKTITVVLPADHQPT